MIYVGFDFDSIRGLVMMVLKEKPETRSDDIKLYIECCRELGIKTFDELYNYGLNFETIRRNRQKIQNDQGLYKAPQEVIDARRRKEVIWKNKILEKTEAE